MSLYLRHEDAPTLPAPVRSTGLWAWLREHIFSGWVSGPLALAVIALIIWVTPDLIRFFILDAIWSANDGAACRVQGTGACWAFVDRKLDFFRYGSYPETQHWRVDIVLMLGSGLAARLLWPEGKKSRAGLFWFLIGVPLFIFLMIPGPAAILREPSLELAVLAGGVALACALEFLKIRTLWVGLFFFVIYPIIAVYLLKGSVTLGLIQVDTNLWGGIFLSLLVATVGIVFSLPAGILLALGRRSELPAVRFFSILYIEFVRGVPFIIPGIVNIFISLFKDTTLVAIVGIFDFLRAIDAARIDPVWTGPTVSPTVYTFAAAFYFLFCFGMSRYSQMMEQRLNAGRRR